ncbi:hypothetical protein RHMOL_Rhmol01G0041100 [Rhododendron molle]|uniref:Uncharacterized protein n=1 Tax=Rhododendron molle TaxID=49168 RepID=A0ACC0PZG0_RHOML|nr:hypothetical protein RHMOL_Rhmol01G0041100 [Rhododendron molle]
MTKDNGLWVSTRTFALQSSSTMVECWAIREGLKLALDRNLFGILVETDSHASTQLIMEETLDSHELGNIIFDWKSMLRNAWERGETHFQGS